MTKRLDQEREAELQPKRMGYAMEQFSKINVPVIATDGKYIKVQFKGNIITFYPYSGYFNGKGVRPGRGIKTLIDQLK